MPGPYCPRPYCPLCGRPRTAGVDHSGCDRRADLEPPRYCATCGRRMVVQVTPSGWSARCARHGQLAG